MGLKSGEILEFQLSASARPERLDKALARHLPQFSRSRLQGWIQNGHVSVNGTPATGIRTLVGSGTRLTVHIQPAPEDLAFVPEPMPLGIVEENPAWLLVNKPAGLVTHPGAGNWHGTLLNGLLHAYPELQELPRAGIVHRLDKNTSGLLVVARTPDSQQHLMHQMRQKTVLRQYSALVHGQLRGSGTIDAPIGRDIHVPVRRSTEPSIAPKSAITHYHTMALGMDGNSVILSALRCRLETGRTHQIRVHLAHLGHPLLGDTLYGGKSLYSVNRHMLHAQQLAFDDPVTGKRCSFQAEEPADMLALRQQLQWVELPWT